MSHKQKQLFKTKIVPGKAGSGKLFEEKFIAREKGSGTWQSILESMDNAGFDSKKLKIHITMGNTVSVIQGILNHVGISILSTIAVKDDIDKGRIKVLSVRGLDLNRFFYLTLAKKRTLSPICEKFLEFTKLTLR